MIFGLTVVMYAYLAMAYVFRGHVSVYSVPIVLFALYFVDAGSGVVHFVIDYTPNVRNVGLKELFEYKGKKGSQEYIAMRDTAMRKINGFQELIFDFKVHHLSPRTLGRRSLLRMTLPIVVFGTFPSTLVILVLGESTLLHADVSLFCLVVLAAGTIAQYAHACTHKREVPPVIKALQACHLLLTEREHQGHHVDPQRDFCLLNGWANPLINRVFQVVLARGYLRTEGLRVV